MAGQPPSDAEFHTWSEISGYLSISVREAQNREKHDDMPVHRLPGKKPRVWAYRSELDAWKKRPTRNQILAVAADGRDAIQSHGGQVIENAPGSSNHRLIPRRSIIASVGITGAASVYIATIFGRRRTPERAVLSGNLLTALDGLGRTTWKYRFEGTPRSNLAPWQVQVVDLNKDGHPGVLVACNFIHSPGAEEPGQGELFYFDADGNLKWTLPADPGLLDFNGQAFASSWNYSHVMLTPSRGGQTIWAAVRHGFRWPGCVLRIDAKGKSRVHVANAGNVERLGYVHRADGDFIVFAGENNAFDRACVGLIGVDDPPAVSPPSAALHYRFRNGPQGGPRSYLLFPTVELAAARGAPYGSAAQVACHRGGVVVEVGQDGAFVQYELSEKLEPLAARPSGSYPLMHRQLEERGILKHTWADCPEVKKPLVVRRFDSGSGWRDENIPWRLPGNTA